MAECSGSFSSELREIYHTEKYDLYFDVVEDANTPDLLVLLSGSALDSERARIDLEIDREQGVHRIVALEPTSTISRERLVSVAQEMVNCCCGPHMLFGWEIAIS
jgi:hypothetical protein